MSATKIIKGIAAYKAQQAHLLKSIGRHGLTQARFDEIYRHEPFAPCAWSGDTLILPFNDGDWGEWLALLQFMGEAGLIGAVGKPPNIVYHVVDKHD